MGENDFYIYIDPDQDIIKTNEIEIVLILGKGYRRIINKNSYSKK